MSREISARRLLAAVIGALGLWLVAGCASAAAPRSNTRATAGPAPRAARAGPAIGISDNSPATFVDPRFSWLGIRLARLVVPWDALNHQAEATAVRAWLTQARMSGVTPLVVFDHSAQRPKELPSVGVWIHQVDLFRHLYPWVHEYTPWDEENHAPEPTAAHPEVAAEYYDTLRQRCPSCTVLAADVLDETNMVSWVRHFLQRARNPRLWGLHNYFDVNRGGHRRTAQLLALVHGDVWFTETGGLVWRYQRKRGGGGYFIVRGERYAANAARRLFTLMRYSPRITRVYYYHWRIPTSLASARRHPGTVTWDSGLIRPDCSARPAFALLARVLGRDPAKAPRAALTPGGYACVVPPPAK